MSEANPKIGPAAESSDESSMMTAEALDAAILALERKMPDLQHRCRDLFSYANAWAEAHDGIISRTPPQLRATTERRLHRIGVRWGVANGVRLTGQFPAYKPG